MIMKKMTCSCCAGSGNIYRNEGPGYYDVCWQCDGNGNMFYSNNKQVSEAEYEQAKYNDDDD